jgi:hypothetical protein
MARKPLLKNVKKRSPKVPDYTCTDIDNVIAKLERHMVTEKLLRKSTFKLLECKLERLRRSNEALRDSGRYWYEQYKKLLERL